MYKSGVNWRQLMKSPTLEFCDFITSTSKFPFFEALLLRYQNMHPNLPWHCPIKPGRYESLYVNITAPAPSTLFSTIPTMKVKMPNGFYRGIIHAFTKSDPMAFKLDWTNEVYEPLGENRF